MAKVCYEWVAEEMDGEAVMDTNGFDRLGDALQLADLLTRESCRCRIALRRDIWDEFGRLVDRGYAYTRDGRVYTDGTRFPKRMLKRLAMIRDWFWIHPEEAEGSTVEEIAQ